jgi:hypothetical protein
VKSLEDNNCIIVKDNIINLNYSCQVVDPRFYVLGCYHSLAEDSSKLKLDALLQKVLLRETLSW